VAADHGNDFVQFGSTDNNGEFNVSGLLPERYLIVVLGNEEHKPYADPIQFEVSNQDISGLTVKTSPGASLSGSVVIEGTLDQTVLTKLLQLRLDAGNGRLVGIEPDGTFQIRGLSAGVVPISLLSPHQTTEDFVILRTERDGVIQAQPIQIRSQEQIAGLKLVVGYGSGIVRGAVRYENGSLPAGSEVTVGLFRADSRSAVKTSLVDVRGNFVLEGVPAGSYWIGLRAYIPKSGRSVSVRQRVDVANGAVSVITVILDLNSNSPAKPQ
jgi:hypothetical protein